MAPTLAAANAIYERRLAEAAKGDANNQLWAIEAIQDYNPEPDLDKITAKVLLINDAEDHANPPELGTVERAMQRVKHGRYVLIPASPDTHGHFSSVRRTASCVTSPIKRSLSLKRLHACVNASSRPYRRTSRR